MHKLAEHIASCRLRDRGSLRPAPSPSLASAPTVPAIFKWLPRASLIKQSFEALCVNEFPGQQFEPDANGGGMRNGQQVLQWLSFDRSRVSARCVSQARIMIFYYWATLCILKARQPRYMAVQRVGGEEASAKGEEEAEGKGQEAEGKGGEAEGKGN
ncbi:ABC transporter G family member 7 [Tetrabaena socialis]|uniref:ABC transporter G family member 7 n=1 Tax=Tetrabaena socialis TaxID=47790 RepID=A0A2J8AGY3_9CHLO|nr:ABC transporter G family member 7 [Tetrabaena socialis]|eukprot:PNH11771.1 ABC transporter G family member 7 [Tetrabaena socialis]